MRSEERLDVLWSFLKGETLLPSWTLPLNTPFVSLDLRKTLLKSETVVPWDLAELANDLKFLGSVPEPVALPDGAWEGLLDLLSEPPPSKLRVLWERLPSPCPNGDLPRAGDEEREWRVEPSLEASCRPGC